MQIIYNVPHVFHALADTEENAYALRAFLDCLVALNLAHLKNHNPKPLYESGVTYGRTTWWEPIPALYERGFGDCKSLTAARVAEYRKQGIPVRPVFRWIRRPDTGARDFHILVETANGFEDPSRILGMGKNENAPHQ